MILPNTPAASTLPAVEIEKRTNSFNARRVLLRSNPALYVSKTRLSVRQLPPFVTERGLRRLATHAVRAFDREVKAGTRAGLTRDELEEGVEAAPEGGADAEKGKDAWTGKGKEKEKGRKEGRKGWNKAGRDAPLVRQAKIVRQADRVDTATGLGRSRGYGFVELRTHADALRVLRWANNSRETEGLFAQWWAAEAGERATAEEAKGEDGKKRAEKLKKEAQAFAARGTGKEEAAGDEVEAAEGVAEKRGKGKGTLIVEFSIENVQVVQRRAARERDSKTTGPVRLFRSHRLPPLFVLLSLTSIVLTRPAGLTLYLAPPSRTANPTNNPPALRRSSRCPSASRRKRPTRPNPGRRAHRRSGACPPTGTAGRRRRAQRRAQVRRRERRPRRARVSGR